MIFGWLLQIFFVVFVIGVLLRRITHKEQRGTVDPNAIRHAFQFSIIYGLTFLIGIGMSGLISLIFETRSSANSDQSSLAQNLAFSVVGIPLLVGLALWTRRNFSRDESESQSASWLFYIFSTSVTSLLMAATASSAVLHDVVAKFPNNPTAEGRALAWGAIWATMLVLDRKYVDRSRSNLLHLAGSLIGLIYISLGIGNILSGIFQFIIGDQNQNHFILGSNPIVSGLIFLLIGVPIWSGYWIRVSSKTAHDTLWQIYLLIIGIAAGLILALVSMSAVLYKVLLWLFGNTQNASAQQFFNSFPNIMACALVGALLWWYHGSTLGQDRKAVRNEIRRSYEYLISAIGLLTAAVGLTIILVSIIESSNRNWNLLGLGSRNTLILALTILVVAVPVWRIYWIRIQRFVVANRGIELRSPSRRIYLFMLFGFGGLAAIISTIVGVYFFFQDTFNGNLSAITFYHMRFPISLLLATGAVAGYHWSIYRVDRKYLPAVALEISPRFIILVGPMDQEIAGELSRRTGDQVQIWIREDNLGIGWEIEELEAVVKNSSSPVLLVLSDADGMQAIPLHR
jgi:hypothetical protein